jgi:dsRNA-specific ribonuclease
MWAQKEKKEFQFVVIEDSSASQDKLYTIEARANGEKKGVGQHFSKKRAEQIAAENALNKLNEEV